MKHITITLTEDQLEAVINATERNLNRLELEALTNQKVLDPQRKAFIKRTITALYKARVSSNS